MKTTISSLCVVALALFCLHQIEAQSNIVDQTCELMGNKELKELCLKTLNADPTSKSADIHGLCKIALKAAVKEAKSVQKKVKKLNASNKDEIKRPAYQTCVILYDDAVNILEKSFSAIDNRSYDDVNIWVSGAITSGVTCEDSFTLEGRGSSNLGEDLKNFVHIANIVLDIANKAGGIVP